jgi:hypothetical protein
MFASSAAYAVNQCAWSVYRGILKANGYAEDAQSTFSMPAGSAPPYRKVVLDNSLVTVSGSDGSYTFYGVPSSKHLVKVLEE